MRYSPCFIAAVAALLGAGCAADPEPPISIELVDWDCRSEQPKRLTAGDSLAPNFTGMEFPENDSDLNAADQETTAPAK